MDRVKVVILSGKERVLGANGTAWGLDLRLEHPETGEQLACRDVRLSFPLDGVVTATADFIVSEIVCAETRDEDGE